MTIREEIISATRYYDNCWMAGLPDGEHYACHWNESIYSDKDTYDLVNKVINGELARLEFRLSLLSSFNEDDQGALQELRFYRNRLSSGLEL